MRKAKRQDTEENKAKKKKRNCIKGCTVWGRREACIYQLHAPCKKPPGTETPVNSGNKKMIKSDLMSCRRQAKTHICHCETDAPTPPSHFSLPHSHSSSHSLIHYTLLSLMGFFFSYQDPYLPKPDSRSLQITLNSTNTCFPVGSSHTHTLSCFDCWIMHYDYFHMKHLKKKKKKVRRNC